MARVKEVRFPVAVSWRDGRPATSAAVAGKTAVDVAAPPELGGAAEGVWSPEDMLVASVATCFAVTLTAIARHRGLPVSALRVDGVGTVGTKDGGRLGFTSIELEVVAATPSEDAVAGLEAAIDRAERSCLVSGALAVPVVVSADVALADAVAGAGTVAPSAA